LTQKQSYQEMIEDERLLSLRYVCPVYNEIVYYHGIRPLWSEMVYLLSNAYSLVWAFFALLQIWLKIRSSSIFSKS
jgi:hypothetical protein